MHPTRTFRNFSPILAIAVGRRLVSWLGHEAAAAVYIDRTHSNFRMGVDLDQTAKMIGLTLHDSSESGCTVVVCTGSSSYHARHIGRMDAASRSCGRPAEGNSTNSHFWPFARPSEQTDRPTELVLATMS